jgi:hypothetical protein
VWKSLKESAGEQDLCYSRRRRRKRRQGLDTPSYVLPVGLFCLPVSLPACRSACVSLCLSVCLLLLCPLYCSVTEQAGRGTCVSVWRGKREREREREREGWRDERKGEREKARVEDAVGLSLQPLSSLANQSTALSHNSAHCR